MRYFYRLLAFSFLLIGLAGCVHVVPDYECLRVEAPVAKPAPYTNTLKQANIDVKHHAYKKALHEYTWLALEGNAEAQYRLGYMYLYGQGTQKNKFLSRGWFQKSAVQGHKKAAQALQLIDRP